ncbi:MAG: hypothetical protein C0456_13690 [Hyphomonas sp.]|uniref:hypothetical protein n=1 Tax=Hyphomonas sp. TaxID=87 RepID=UPI001D345326|nr:hypothetical protein [Hyphomonas sp.]MBA4227675.1 hypothetical protein [Hyphomonas sp.]
MKTRALLLAAIGSAVLAACQTAPAAPEPEPVAEELPVIDLPPPPASDEPRVNEWGGEVPENKPAGDVDEGGLGDIS